MSSNPPKLSWPEIKVFVTTSIKEHGVVSARLMDDCTQFILDDANNIDHRLEALDCLTNTVMGMDEPTDIEALEQFVDDYNLLLKES